MSTHPTTRTANDQHIQLARELLAAAEAELARELVELAAALGHTLTGRADAWISDTHWPSRASTPLVARDVLAATEAIALIAATEQTDGPA